MRVARGHHSVGGRDRGSGQRGREHRPSGRGGAGDVVGIHHVDHRVQGPQELVPAWGVDPKLVHESGERGDVGEQCGDLGAPLGQHHLAEPVQRLPAGRRRIPVRVGAQVLQLQDVRRGCLHVHGEPSVDQRRPSWESFR